MSEEKESTETTAIEELLGPSLLMDSENKVSTSSRMQGKKLVLLYFSASWCPPCKAFTPELSKFYEKHCVQNGVEVVYISSDQNIRSFNEYFAKMPWPALPFVGTNELKQKLATLLKISGIPSLVVLETETGYFISDNARYEVMNCRGNDEKSKELIESWNNSEAVPIEQAKLSSTSGGILQVIFKTLVTNPTLIIALVYFGKKLLRKLQEVGSEEDEL